MAKERADARLGRLLAIVPWVAAHDGPTVDEVCRRFGVAEKDLVDDLNLLWMCGVYPFTPDVLIDVNFSDGRVWISMADYFRRPLRLNSQEALALASAAKAFLDLPGGVDNEALASALAKLETILGVGVDEAFEVNLGEVPSAVLDTIASAAAAHHKVGIDYYSFGRDGHSHRVIHPWRVFNSEGQWYVRGWCEAVRAERLFRIDRISEAEAMTESFDPPAGADRRTSTFSPSDDDPRIVIDIDAPARWIAEQYPNDSVEARPDGVLRVSMRAGQQAWLERLLLRGGRHVRLVEGDRSLGPAAAARVLSRYRRG